MQLGRAQRKWGSQEDDSVGPGPPPPPFSGAQPIATRLRGRSAPLALFIKTPESATEPKRALCGALWSARSGRQGEAGRRLYCTRWQFRAGRARARARRASCRAPCPRHPHVSQSCTRPGTSTVTLSSSQRLCHLRKVLVVKQKDQGLHLPGWGQREDGPGAPGQAHPQRAMGQASGAHTPRGHDQTSGAYTPRGPWASLKGPHPQRAMGQPQGPTPPRGPWVSLQGPHTP